MSTSKIYVLRKTLSWLLLFRPKLLLFFFISSLIATVHGGENINRGLIGMPKGNGEILISWRFLTTDSNDTAFDVYRSETSGGEFQKINNTPIKDATTFIDQNTKVNNTYFYKVHTLNETKSISISDRIRVKSSNSNNNVIHIPGKSNKKVIKVVTGDLNGDGHLDFVTIATNAKLKDPHFGKIWSKSNRNSDTFRLDAYLHNGTHLWTYDLGWGIETGYHYSPFTIWDLDGDNKAEVITKTVKSSNPIDYSKEHLTVLNGQTGKVKSETRWLDPVKQNPNGYNENSRNHIAIAYLDGKQPFIILGRGTYGSTALAAYYPDLTLYWKKKLSANACHCMEIADIDNDGKDEIFWGDSLFEENGNLKWIAPRRPYGGHPNLLFVADFQPDNPGLEVFYGREGWGGKKATIGNLLLDSNGKELWSDMNHMHVKIGVVGNFSAKYPGMEIFTGKESNPGYGSMGPFSYTAKGAAISPGDPWGVPVQWDGSSTKKQYNPSAGKIRDYDSGQETFIGKGQNTPRGPVVADILGDYREEIITPAGSGIKIYTNTQGNNSRRITPLLNKKYRLGMARTGMQYLRLNFEGQHFFDGSITPTPRQLSPKPPTPKTNNLSRPENIRLIID